MSVLVLAPHFAEYSERLAAGLARRVPTDLVVNTSDWDAHVETPVPGKAALHVMRMDRRKEQLAATARILWLAWRRRPDLVIVQEGVRPMLKVLVALLRRRARVALIVHDPMPHSGRDQAQAARHVPFRRWLRRHAHWLIVHGESCREEMVHLGYDGARILAIQHGTLLEPDPARALPPTQPDRVLMFGRMEAYKGLEVLVEAAERLHAAGRPMRLVIAGKGPEQTRLAARIAALPGAQAIDRYLEPGDLQAEIARAACVVAPYLDATQSGVLASAFANGKPVVASRVGGLGDVVHDGANGLLVPPGDAAALAGAIGRILDDAPLREALTQGARAFAAGALNWNSIAARILDFSPEI